MPSKKGPCATTLPHSILVKLPESGTPHLEYQNLDSAQELRQTPHLSGKQRTAFLFKLKTTTRS